MPVDVIVGLQWGDEGKGKIVDLLSPHYQIIARFQGGPNAGHTLVVNGKKYILHTIPSGIIHPHTLNVIGNGVVLDPVVLMKEVETLRQQGIDATANLVISYKASLIVPTHKLLDAADEQAKGKQKIGSTLKGIGPTYTDKTAREGLRTADLFSPAFEERYQKLKEKHLSRLGSVPNELQELEEQWMEAIQYFRKLRFEDTEMLIHEALQAGQEVLAEGAQGTLLDIDFGTFPFVTSSNTISAAACTGLGISPQAIRDVIGIFKAYTTRVGSGPFPTELLDERGDQLRVAGQEFGSTTGRPRRCGWLDLPALQYSVMLNGVTKMAITKVDILSDLTHGEICVDYQHEEQSLSYPAAMRQEDFKPLLHQMEMWKELDPQMKPSELPSSLQEYLGLIEKHVKAPIRFLSTGPGREQTLELP